MGHDETIRREFSKQAAHFGDKGLTLSSQEYLAWMVERLPLEPGFSVLDVAAGTGHLSRAIASRVLEVVALDMTLEMIKEARKEAADAGIRNIVFEQGDARDISHRDAKFDMVVSRLAIHHFVEPEVQLREMVRVCKPGHTVAIMDLLSPSEDQVREIYNRLERLRDPSHVAALTRNGLIGAMESSGLAIDQVHTRDIEVDFERWAAMTGTALSTKEFIQRELERDIAGDNRTGMRPYRQDGRLKFLQVWSVLIGIKPAGKASLS
jgi:ubiquinone/menaquinone biosynthesis C-methylase UbiE